MRPRHGIVELFSTFLQFEADRFRNWVTDPRLRRSIERGLTQATQPDLPEHFWALYWHQRWQAGTEERVSKEHLVAYVQEPCYWVAHRTTTGFSSTQYSLADCFQMAIAQIDKILKGFNSQQGYNLKNYASATLHSLIRESLRQRQEIDICTDWALLRKLSQRRLVEALEQAGLPAPTIASYTLAWTCFRTLYVPKQPMGTRQLPKPDRALLEAIGQLYQSERTTEPPAPSPDQLEKWLITCAKAARAYLYPNLLSLNTPKTGQDAEYLDDLAETAQSDSLLTELIAAEEIATRQTQQAQIGTVLTAAIQQLDPQSQTLIQLYYGDTLTQQQMADRLNVKQYTVSRRLTKLRETLLHTLTQWSQDTLHITPNSDVVKYMSAALEEWLKTKYDQDQEMRR